ncbi:hypothetical protein AUK04_01865 [Candidatus Roizmanbacteria bacterium CG2_30_33_16]|uniref:Type II secretion system protein GspG C-terminal domain-containing protein n=5 Tax=Candidatus Roizmaniibacteriota TaxID=1752723 RepID=A0A2M7E567_9BACT|nr:MAG: hypothetical protein AUK04_01865 [Candidatus Roizmanbacteria bacterium CG2_30_33_16]PIP64863.1 MAG: hypothetical protein COW96_00205 [Candidatus Roizmanbacteria bacterium CG22_combo_CG10-13_8_21_14_all_33_16]PIV62859.1 MAG: hypothetical protein COS12_00830 [Candidatus Roizmanbacteria bacterium CG01_land_8_20_14_3_00_33_9]
MKKNIIAFTLIEILVVTTIIGILTAAGATAYSMMGKTSRDARRKADLEQIRSALEMYRSNSTSSSYPTTAEGLAILSSGSPKYLETAITDPKSGNSYKYTSTSGSDYTLSTYLEIPGTVECDGATCDGGAKSCTYCLGPYGKK